MESRKSYSNSESKNGVFLIDTDIQLYNALRYVLSRNLTGKLDAIIQMKSRNAEERIQLLRESGVFNRVYDIALDKHTKIERVGVFWGLLFPRFHLKRVHNLNIWKHYERVYLAFATKTFDLIISASGCKNIIGFDDGMGSYIGDPFEDNYKKGYLSTRRMLGHDYRINTVYLNNPSCYNANTGFDIQNIVGENIDFDYRIIYRIFDFKEPDDLVDKKFIFLNQAVTDTDDYIEKEYRLAEITDDITEGQVIVRMHPSEKRIEKYSSMPQDRTKNMWELICSKEISDDNVLIGFFSTAQFSPKLLADNEPYIIFTFNMFDDYPEDKKQKFHKYVNFFRTKYKSAHKIFVPSTIEEFKKCLESVRKERESEQC